jgi:hypothetical protein
VLLVNTNFSNEAATAAWGYGCASRRLTAAARVEGQPRT